MGTVLEHDYLDDVSSYGMCMPFLPFSFVFFSWKPLSLLLHVNSNVYDWKDEEERDK